MSLELAESPRPKHLDKGLPEALDRLRVTVLAITEALTPKRARRCADRVLADLTPVATWGLAGSDARDVHLRTMAIEQQLTNFLQSRDGDYHLTQPPEEFLAEAKKLYRFLIADDSPAD